MINVKIRSKGAGRHLSMYFVDPVTKKEVTRSAGTSDLRQAQKNAIRWEDELKRSRGENDDHWDYVLDRFEAEHVVATKTQESYTTGLNSFRRFWSGKRLGEITPTVISQWQASLRPDHPPTTIGSYLRSLKVFLRWTAKMRIIDSVPAIFMPKIDGRRLAKGRALTDKEWGLFLKNCPGEQWERFATLIRLGGFRLEEAFICTWDGPRIRVEPDAKPFPRIWFRADSHKARRDMFIPMTPDLQAWLHQVPRAQRRGIVCRLESERSDEPIVLAATAGRYLSDAGREAGIVTGRKHKGGGPLFASAHDLRRTFGTHWASRVKPLTLQRLMRHTDFATTLKYYVDLSLEDIANDIWSSVPKIVPDPEKIRELLRWAECDFPEENQD